VGTDSGSMVLDAGALSNRRDNGVVSGLVVVCRAVSGGVGFGSRRVHYGLGGTGDSVVGGVAVDARVARGSARGCRAWGWALSAKSVMIAGAKRERVGFAETAEDPGGDLARVTP